MAKTDPSTPKKMPAGSSVEYWPNIYAIAPPIYEPATPNATVFRNPKFSSPGTMLFAMLPTKIPYTVQTNILIIRQPLFKLLHSIQLIVKQALKSIPYHYITPYR